MLFYILAILVVGCRQCAAVMITPVDHNNHTLTGSNHCTTRGQYAFSSSVLSVFASLTLYINKQELLNAADYVCMFMFIKTQY